MASYDPEFYEAPKAPAGYDDARPRQRGCFFYGCVIASVLTVLLIILLAVLAFIGARFFYGLVEQWTAPTPMELPRVQISEEGRKSVQERILTFRTAIEAGTAVDPLVLTSEDLNALIEDAPDFKGKVYARVEGDKLKAQVSIPLDNLEVGPLRGRFLNGEAELKASLKSGVLIVTLDSLEVNGKQLPGRFLEELRAQNLAKDAYKNPRNAEMIRRFESIQIQDGKIILRPRAAEKPPSDAGNLRPPDSLAPDQKPGPTHAEAPGAEVPAGKTP